MNKSIPLPEKAKARVQQSLDAIQRIQESTGAYLEGVAATLQVPDGYTFDQSAMAFVPPPSNASGREVDTHEVLDGTALLP